MCHGPAKPAHYYDEIEPSTKPRFGDVRKEAPLAKSHCPISTTGDQSLHDNEYIIPDPQHTPDNNDSLYVSMDQDKSDHYTSLSVTHVVPVYQPLKH